MMDFRDEPNRKPDLVDRWGEAIIVVIVIILIGLTVWLSIW